MKDFPLMLFGARQGLLIIIYVQLPLKFLLIQKVLWPEVLRKRPNWILLRAFLGNKTFYFKMRAETFFLRLGQRKDQSVNSIPDLGTEPV